DGAGIERHAALLLQRGEGADRRLKSGLTHRRRHLTHDDVVHAHSEGVRGQVDNTHDCCTRDELGLSVTDPNRTLSVRGPELARIPLHDSVAQPCELSSGYLRR